jgi:hypothetical protein
MEKRRPGAFSKSSEPVCASHVHVYLYFLHGIIVIIVPPSLQPQVLKVGSGLMASMVRDVGLLGIGGCLFEVLYVFGGGGGRVRRGRQILLLYTLSQP